VSFLVSRKNRTRVAALNVLAAIQINSLLLLREMFSQFVRTGNIFERKCWIIPNAERIAFPSFKLSFEPADAAPRLQIF